MERGNSYSIFKNPCGFFLLVDPDIRPISCARLFKRLIVYFDSHLVLLLISFHELKQGRSECKFNL